MLDELDHGAALRVIVLDDKQPLHLLVDELRDLRERFVQRLARDRLLEVSDRARLESRLTLSHTTDDVYRHVTRVRVVLESIEHGPSIDAGQIDVERDRVRLVRVRDTETRFTIERDNPLEVLVARHVEKNLRKLLVVLDDEKDAIRRIEPVAIVVESSGARNVACFLDSCHG